MQRKYIIESDESVFIGCKEESYLKKIQDKAERLFLCDENQLTPKILEQSPYKLHVSLKIEDYIKHKDKIKEIIITHLENGAINDFKFINNELLKSNIESSEQLLKLASEYKNMLEKSDKPDAEWEAKFILALDTRFGVDSLPDIAEVIMIINRLNNSIISGRRLLEGDQFTIYLPEGFDKDKIFNLCKDISMHLEMDKAVPGKLLDVESPIGDFINLRQEYLMEDFHSVNECGLMDMHKRISSVKEHDDEIENDRRRRVVIEQENSDFYKFIRSKFTKSPNLQRQKSIFQPPEEKKKERAINKGNNFGF